jgi:hypothetical protein
MPQVVLDLLEPEAGVEQMGRNGVPKPMTREVTAQACSIAVPSEERLDLPLAECAAPSGEQRRRGFDASVELPTQELRSPVEKHLLA